MDDPFIQAVCWNGFWLLALDNLGIAVRELEQPDRAATCWRDTPPGMRDARYYE